MMLDPRAQEHEIAAAARHYAGRARTVLHAIDRHAGATREALQSDLDRLARECDARPVAPDVLLSGRIARMVDVPWWTRNLRRELLRKNEAQEFAAGRIRRKGACYVSDHAMRRLAQRALTNRAILEGLEVVNEEGAAANLAQVSDASVSNPKLRRTELMVRCRGFEDVATMMGHEAVFLTLTCPSRFHRFDGGGKPNAKWDGSTPKDAQGYLNEVWARIRAEWKRNGFSPYGFRVAEPHHDGCPHWHLLLFVPADHAGWFVPRRFVADRADHGAGVIGIAGAHALADSPGEAGAVKHRFTCERIDAAKGSATGYIAKYISKNIDGEKEDGGAVGLDFASGTRAVDSAKRVRAWASTWGIRQFQQIGGPSVTVWRELRRLARDAENPVLQLELFEGPRSAADRAMWGLFWFLQGGPDVPRRELTLRPAYAEQGGGRYGDAQARVHGVLGADEGREHFQLTREHTWTVQVAGQAATDAEQEAWRTTLTVRRENAEMFAAFARVSGISDPSVAQSAAPWTGVNNCTDADEAAAVRADFLRGMGGQTIGVDPPCTESDATSRHRNPPPTRIPSP